MRLDLVGGANLVVPKGSVAGPGTVTGSVTTGAETLPAASGGESSSGSKATGEGLVEVGPAYSFEIEGTTLTGPVTITLPVPPASPVSVTGTTGSVSPPDVALLAFRDPASGTWKPVMSQYDPVTRMITAEVKHLSLWTVLRANTEKLLAGAVDILQGFLGVKDTVDDPKCPTTTKLSSTGIKVKSDSGGLVKWCASVDSTGRTVVRVGANRHYALEADYPAAWSQRRVGPQEPVADSIAKHVGQWLSPTEKNVKAVILPGGTTYEFIAPAGAGGTISVVPSAPAYLASALLYGIETLVMTMGAIPGAPKADPSRTAKVVQLVFDSKSCVTNMLDLMHNDISSPAAVGAVFRSGVDISVGCLGSLWTVGYGITGFLGQFLVSVLLWLVDGIKLVVDGLRAAVETAIYWRMYRIVVSAAPSLALTHLGVGSVRLGTSEQSALAALAPLLGQPKVIRASGPACELFPDAENSRELAWGALHVRFEASTAKGTDFKLVAWNLGRGETPIRMVLPHGVVLGTTRGDQLIAVDPRAEYIPDTTLASSVVDENNISYWLSDRSFDLPYPVTNAITSAGINPAYCE